MTLMLDPKAIANKYGGDACGNQVNIPTEGHGKHDRGTSITIDPSAPDGVLIYVHNGGDPMAVKDKMRRDGFLPARNREPDTTFHRRTEPRQMLKEVSAAGTHTAYAYHDENG
ncbi:MAG: hypothetical protein ACK5NN_07435, partial [Sphingomonadaceae bacterium]